MTVYEELCQIFGKDQVDYAIAEANGEYRCTCHVKGADKCRIHNELAGARRSKEGG